MSLHQFPRSEENEYLEPSDPEILAFLQKSSPSNNGVEETDLIQALVNSDRELARITEDLITLLIEKKIIIFTELPEAVQRKLMEREKLRDLLTGGVEGFIDDEFQLI